MPAPPNQLPEAWAYQYCSVILDRDDGRGPQPDSWTWQVSLEQPVPSERIRTIVRMVLPEWPSDG